MTSACLLPEVWEELPEQQTSDQAATPPAMDSSSKSATATESQPSSGVSDPANATSMSMNAASAGNQAASASAGAGGMATTNAQPASTAIDTTNGCALASDLASNGAFTPAHLERVGTARSTWVFYPTPLGPGGTRHAVLFFGPNLDTSPSAYVEQFNRIASHGFVVVADTPGALLDGSTEKAALSFIENENRSPSSMFYQKLDTRRLGVGAQATASTSGARLAEDPRITLFAFVCLRFGGVGVAKFGAPALIVSEENEIDANGRPTDNVSITSPFIGLVNGTLDASTCMQDSLTPLLAFLRLQFCGDEQYRSDFLSGRYCQAPWKCTSRGF